MIGAILAASVILAGAADDVAKLSWLAGSWVHEKDGVVTRETWLAPRDGAMAGAAQTNRPGKRPSIEFVRITAEPAGATFTALVGSQPPTPFVLLPGQDGEAVFENKATTSPSE